MKANRREQVRRQQEAAARAQTTRRLVVAFAAVVAIALVFILGYSLVTRSAVPGTPAAPASDSPATPAATQITPAGASERGDSLVVGQGRAGSPRVTLYLDYQCPNCRIFEEGFGAMLVDGAAAGDWTLQYKTMTFMDTTLANTGSTRAALAASCAADAGHFEAFHEQVYANQARQEVRGGEGYSDEMLRQVIPAAAGITGDALTSFQACYDGRATQDFVDLVNNSAESDGVRGTPTLAVNGRLVDFDQVKPLTPDGLRAHLLANA